MEYHSEVRGKYSRIPVLFILFFSSVFCFVNVCGKQRGEGNDRSFFKKVEYNGRTTAENGRGRKGEVGKMGRKEREGGEIQTAFNKETVERLQLFKLCIS